MTIYTKYPIRDLKKEQQEAIQSFSSNDKIQYENIKCILCGSLKNKILFKNDCYGIKQQTVMCKKCGLIYLNPRMTEESTNYFYSSDIYRKIYGGIKSIDRYLSNFKRQYNNNNKLDLNEYYPELFYDFINNNEIYYDSVCEIGAGGGWNLIPFISNGKQVSGYEPSPLLCNLGKETANINLINGFVNDVEGNHDLVILKHVLEHFNNPLNILLDIRNNINKYLFIEVPGYITKIPKIQNAHNYYFTLNTLEAILTKAGFKTITIDYCKSNDYIFGLFEKSDIEINTNYSAREEIRNVLKIYKRDKLRFMILHFLFKTKLYPIAKFLKSLLRK